MIYHKNVNDYYVELIHLITNQDLTLSLYDKRKIDKQIIKIVKYLRKINLERKKDYES